MPGRHKQRVDATSAVDVRRVVDIVMSVGDESPGPTPVEAIWVSEIFSHSERREGSEPEVKQRRITGMKIDKALAIFDEIRSELEEALETVSTEQDTRLHLIDRLLVEVLGWPRALISTESHGEHGYVDYLLKSPERSLFVVEAKCIGKVLVDTKNPKLSHYKLGSPVLKSAQDGIVQARRYCFDHGVVYAALTSGTEWIGFTAIRTDGKLVNDGTAIVFPTLSSIYDDFAVFFELFSYDGHYHEHNRIRFQDAEGLKVSHSEVLHTILDPRHARLIPKTSMASDMDSIFREFFGSMSSSDPEMLAKCFVESKESKEADVSLHKLTSNLVNQIQVVKSDTGDSLAKHIETAVATSRGEFVLIIGNKGAGKSTFIDRFFRLVLNDVLRSKCLLIRVDLADSTGDASTLVSWLTAEIQKCIEFELFDDSIPTFDQLRGIFWSEYTRWKKGEFKHLYDSDREQFKIRFGEYLNRMVAADKETYVKRLLQDAVQSRELLPCLIFDNTDHFPQSFQEQVFQYAQSVFRTGLSFVICPITDRTIWQLSKSGPFQSYITTPFYLPIPSTKEVLSKRIDFIKDKLEDDETVKGQYFLERGIRLQVQNLRGFALAIEDVFVHTEYLGRMVGWISNHDIRRGLQVAQQIATSPHVSMEQLFTLYFAGKKPYIQEWKIRKALILGDYKGFTQEGSAFVLNCWSVSKSAPTTPLGKLSILGLLADIDSHATEPEGAYMTASDVVNYFEPMGMSRAATMEQLRELLVYRLVEPYDPTDEAISLEGRVRITHCGRIHMEFCLTDRTYMEQMALATAVQDADFVSRERYRIFGSGRTEAEDWHLLVANFVKYCMKEDKVQVTVPAMSQYKGQRDLRVKLETQWL